MSRDGLIQMKVASGRPQDLADVRRLDRPAVIALPAGCAPRPGRLRPAVEVSSAGDHGAAQVRPQSDIERQDQRPHLGESQQSRVRFRSHKRNSLPAEEWGRRFPSPTRTTGSTLT